MKKPYIKPCPCCGSKEVNLLQTVEANEILWHIECQECGIRTECYPSNTPAGKAHPFDEVFFNTNEAISSAAEMWNTRHYEPRHASHEPSALPLESMSTDDLVSTSKRIADIISKRAVELVNKIDNMIKEENHEHE